MCASKQTAFLVCADPPERKNVNKPNVRSAPNQTKKPAPFPADKSTGRAHNSKLAEALNSQPNNKADRPVHRADHPSPNPKFTEQEEYDRPSSNESGISVSSGRLFKPSPYDNNRTFQSPRSTAGLDLNFPYRKDLNNF